METLKERSPTLIHHAETKKSWLNLESTDE